MGKSTPKVLSYSRPFSFPLAKKIGQKPRSPELRRFSRTVLLTRPKHAWHLRTDERRCSMTNFISIYSLFPFPSRLTYCISSWRKIPSVVRGLLSVKGKKCYNTWTEEEKPKGVHLLLPTHAPSHSSRIPSYNTLINPLRYTSQVHCVQVKECVHTLPPSLRRSSKAIIAGDRWNHKGDRKETPRRSVPTVYTI